ncbi:MAG: hypothetical protein YHS30scaffold324_39 [Catenulispora phage 69_17]|jgi:hypothetical protein|nr:MAG: hypothetical protein YHS30scaffold324_39 [Catenulispora phage 69_17]
MSPLPCFAAHLDGATGAFYAATSTMQTGDDEHLIVWMPSPTMSDGLASVYAWAGAADEQYLETPHVTLNTVAYATLLLLSGLEPLADGLTDAAALTAIDRTLAEAGCDMLRCVWRANVLLDEHPEDCARWHRCLILAARLLKVEA